MPRLIVERNARVEREEDIGTELRIGRDADNDVVLDDTDRGVSRFHAEIRYENGQYVLVDLDSRNGTWIEGQRVGTVALEPGVSFRIGPYQLEFRGDEPEAAAAAAPPTPAQNDNYTVFDPDLAASVRDVEEAPRPVAPSPPPVAARRRHGLVFVAAAAMILAAGAFVWIRRSSAPQIVPASASRQDELVKPRDVVAPPDVSTPPQTSDSTSGGDSTRSSTEPPPTRADTQPRARRPAKTDSVPVGPEFVPRRADESPADWEVRNRRVQEEYAAAKAALAGDDGVLALSHLDAVLRDQPDGYLETMSMITTARGLVRAKARQAFDAAARAEQAKDWLTALQQYDIAHQLDPTTSVTGEMTRVREQMTAQGHDAYAKAKIFDAYGNDGAAVAHYEIAVKMLPSGDPERQLAARRLQALKEKQ